MTLRPALNQQKSYAVIAFLWGLLLAACIVVPIMIADNGYFLYYGDFNAQQIPFYQLAHDAVQSGQTGWSHTTDLGANFVGSYSFYLLGSPFFWVTMILPSAAVPYAMGPLLILKLACCSLTAYIYLRRHVRDRRAAVVGGVLYAFSAFSVYNIFFFHFHEAMILFPLLPAAVDAFHDTGRRGVVAVAVCCCAVINYYFFFGQVVFVAIYWLIRMITKGYRFRIGSFLLFLAECLIGLLMSMALVLPSIAAISGNYRVSEFISGWDALLYPSRRYLQILIAFFFPGDIPARLNFTPDAGGKWASIAAYLPMVSMVFVIAYLRRHRRSFTRILFTVLIVMALVPALNSVFQAMNAAYYARWFYMLTLVTALMTVKALEQYDPHTIKKGLLPAAIITVTITLLIGLTPRETFRDTNVTMLQPGLEETPEVYWTFAGITIFGLGLTALLLLLRRKKPRIFMRALCIALSLFTVGYATVYLWIGKSNTNFSDEYLQRYALNGGADITLPDLNEVRSDFFEAQDNLGMYWQIPNIQAFHSIVPAALMDFYNATGVHRDVASRPSTEYYGLRALLSVKYLFREAGSDPAEESPPMPCFRYLKTENGFDIFINDCYLPMGFTYDAFYSKEEYLNLNNKYKHLALLKGMVLDQYLMKKYADITGYTDGMYLSLNADFDENHPQQKKYPAYKNFDSITSDFVYTVETYRSDVERLKAHTCSSFRYTKDGFEAVYENTGGDNLLFFSVPYDEGWTATVNGEDAGIEKVNLGFMAVKVKGHEKSEIRFFYTTPMLKEGAILSAAGVGLFLIYLTVSLLLRRGNPRRRRTLPDYRVKREKVPCKKHFYHHKNETETDHKPEEDNHELR